MLFNSFEYLVFLPAVFCLYWFVFRQYRHQNVLVVLASYLFYGLWNWRFLSLIFLTTLSSFVSGLLIGRCTDRRARRWVCGANIVLNFAILGIFKYLNFFVENLNIIFSQIGYQFDWFTLDILLPVGISFYTFQAVSYPIDVYRGKINATRDFVSFAAFVSFFPQLVAGPIERSTQLLPQFERSRKFDYATAVTGMRRILWGFFKKLVIADNCALLANDIFANYDSYGCLTLLVGALCFTFQIYGDFSGYSDIAIGSASLFGIRLMQNFHFPLFSRNIAEFWRRWHISLNRWFIEYVYIPLGGSRCAVSRQIINILTVFVLSGLWHGARWTFVLWGLYNGLLFIPLILTHRVRQARPDASLRDIPSISVTFVLVVLGLIIFRSDNVGNGLAYICGVFNTMIPVTTGLFVLGRMLLLYTAMFVILMTAAEWAQRRHEFALDLTNVRSRVLRWTIYLAIILVIVIFAAPREQFIYFQF